MGFLVENSPFFAPFISIGDKSISWFPSLRQSLFPRKRSKFRSKKRGFETGELCQRRIVRIPNDRALVMFVFHIFPHLEIFSNFSSHVPDVKLPNKNITSSFQLYGNKQRNIGHRLSLLPCAFSNREIFAIFPKQCERNRPMNRTTVWLNRFICILMQNVSADKCFRLSWDRKTTKMAESSPVMAAKSKIKTGKEKLKSAYFKDGHYSSPPTVE